LQTRYLSLAPTCALIFMDSAAYCQKCPSSLSLDGLPLRSTSNIESVTWNFSVSLQTALRWSTGNFSANCSCTKSVSIAFYRLVMWCVHHVTKHNTPIHNILSTAPQLSVSQKALGMLPVDSNVMPKHVWATIHNKLN
jgi:hypothetical protein